MTFPEDWSEVDCISHLQRKIILCSIAYYEFDFSPVSDYVYDRWAHDLAKRMRECSDVHESRYYYAFYDFDGSTGYYLYSRLHDEDKNHLTRLAQIGISQL